MWEIILKDGSVYRFTKLNAYKSFYEDYKNDINHIYLYDENGNFEKQIY